LRRRGTAIRVAVLVRLTVAGRRGKPALQQRGAAAQQGRVRISRTMAGRRVLHPAERTIRARRRVVQRRPARRLRWLVGSRRVLEEHQVHGLRVLPERSQRSQHDGLRRLRRTLALGQPLLRTRWRRLRGWTASVHPRRQEGRPRALHLGGQRTVAAARADPGVPEEDGPDRDDQGNRARTGPASARKRARASRPTRPATVGGSSRPG
jgi:hypothetical protein